ncbi:MAG: hypothetical protein D6B25_07460 [Desulfobulbaceae bacterium]|nr:MAG: hypothetical protein D6B25_07460 [Desulfobulbaceae bacterium]
MEQRFNLSWITGARVRGLYPIMVRLMSMSELVVVGLLFYVFVWIWGPVITSFPLPLMAFAYVVVVVYISYISPVLLHGDKDCYRGIANWRQGFIRTDNLGQAGRSFGLIILLGGSGIVVAAYLKNPQVFVELNWLAVTIKYTMYNFSGAIQGCFTLFILFRLMDVLDLNPFEKNISIGGKLVLTGLVSVLFAMMHWPNMPVVIILLVSCPLIMWQFYRAPNFFMLVTSHAILGTLLHRVYELPMRIGPFYHNPDKYILRELFPPLAWIIGNLWK